MKRLKQRQKIRGLDAGRTEVPRWGRIRLWLDSRMLKFMISEMEEHCDKECGTSDPAWAGLNLRQIIKVTAFVCKASMRSLVIPP